MELEKLNIEVNLQDHVMKTFGFTSPAKALELGILVLYTLAQAKENGCDMIYLHKTKTDGTDGYYNFDYLAFIEHVKSSPDGTVHGVKFKIV